MRSASLFVLIEIISKMIHPMKVQLNSIEKRKISHFFSVLFRSAGRMSIMIAGRPTIKVQNVKPNPMLESSPITPSKNHPRAQRITGMVAMAIMMRFVWDLFSGFFHASLRVLFVCGKLAWACSAKEFKGLLVVSCIEFICSWKLAIELLDLC